MKKDTDYSLEDFIAKSQSVLEDLGDIDILTDQLPGSLPESIDLEIHRKSIESLAGEGVELQLNGYAEVRAAEDGMSAAADIFPPRGGMEPVDLDEVAEIIRIRGITFGVDWDAVKDAVLKCNLERVQVTDAAIAWGRKPVNEVPERIVIEARLLQEKAGPGPDAPSIDYRELSPYKLVKKDEVLARISPRRPGAMGMSVTGKSIAYKTEKIPRRAAGPGTVTLDDRIVAEYDGRFQLKDDSFLVNRVLEITGNVDYKTGNINFPGDVVIKGEIKDGFKINTEGSVICLQTLDASEVVCKGDLTVQRGIIGRGKGTVKVGGDIRTRFIENSYVEAQGSIYVDSGIMNSSIHSLESVELGPKGVVIGGQIHAQNGVVAAQIGSALGPSTEIYCGIDYSVEQKLTWIRDKNIALAVKLKQVERRMKGEASGAGKLIAIQGKIKEAIHKLNQAASALVFRLDKNEEASIEVLGSVYPGAYFEICHQSFIVNRPLKRVRIKLDKVKGKLVSETLDAVTDIRRRKRINFENRL